jgi:hypothetical protein
VTSFARARRPVFPLVREVIPRGFPVELIVLEEFATHESRWASGVVLSTLQTRNC